MTITIDVPNVPPNVPDTVTLTDAEKENCRMASMYLNAYLTEMHKIDGINWYAISYSNKVIWREIEQQIDFVKEISKTGIVTQEGV